jgi:hypothetical protein
MAANKNMPSNPGGKDRDRTKGSKVDPAGKPQTTPGGKTQPRFDDRPEMKRGRPGDERGQGNPSLPKYGDTEPNDPRRHSIEANVDANDDSGDDTGDEAGASEER